MHDEVVIVGELFPVFFPLDAPKIFSTANETEVVE